MLRLYNGLQAHYLTPCLCCDFAAVFLIYAKGVRFLPFFNIFVVIFYGPR